MHSYVSLTELSNRESNSSEMGTESHLINIEILDNHEEATIGAFLICDLCAMVGTTINVYKCMPWLY